ncbi:MAG TPA: proline dehydrogenase family protein [bacterium]|nr:proline dehydrogenase family protein [bacterium]
MATGVQDAGGGAMAKGSSTTASAPRRFGSLLSVLLIPFARRFIAGITLSEALEACAKLKAQGFLTTLDHLGESVESAEEAKLSADQYVVMLRALKEKGLDRNVSLKLTQMGLAVDPELCFSNVERIAATAEEIGGFVRVDMEGSDVTQATLDCVARLKKTRGTPVGAVVQAMLKRTPMDIVDLMERAVSIRLCKGAYKEPPDVAHQGMPEIRRQYAALAKRLLTAGGYHAIATHDEELVGEIMAFAKEQRIAPERFEFQMLLGIRPSFQRRIIAEGWRLRLYVPFGKSWLPYTWRRMREKKENMWFVVKCMFQR